jgi:hypothetical protein
MPDKVEAQAHWKPTWGAEVRCTLSHQGTSCGVTATANEVSDGDVGFEAQVNDNPSPGQVAAADSAPWHDR